MVIIGAKGHATEILDICALLGMTDDLSFFDDYSLDPPHGPIGAYPVLRSFEALEAAFRKDPRFVLGLGNPLLRFKLYERCVQAGGRMESVFSPRSYVSSLDTRLGTGLNVMHQVTIQPKVTIGDGCLINAGVLIHHDTCIDRFCEIGPGAVLTGNVSVGEFTMIGAGAIVLPNVRIGKNVRVGAGAVVVKDIIDNLTVKGNPSHKI